MEQKNLTGFRVSEHKNALSQLDVKLILRDPEIKKLYANGFIIHISASDIVLIPALNDTPLQVINLSYTSAKSLAEALSSAVKFFESSTGVEIKTTKEFSKLLKEGIAKEGIPIVNNTKQDEPKTEDKKDVNE
jgi:hypothetical protein